MDQQPFAGGEVVNCFFCMFREYPLLWYYTFYDERDGQHRIVGHSFGKGGFSHHQACDECSLRGWPAACVFTVHNSDAGLEIKLDDALAGHVSHIIQMDTNDQGRFSFFQLRSMYDKLKQYHHARTAHREVSETNFMLKMLLEGLDSDTIFFEPFNLDYGDAQRHTKLWRGLLELEHLGPDYSANDDNDKSTNSHDDSAELSPNSQDGPRVPTNNLQTRIDDVSVYAWPSVQSLALPWQLCSATFGSSPKPYSPRQPSRDAAAAAHVRSTMVKEFREEYHRVVDHIRLEVIIDRFQNTGRAWKCGVDTLRKISNGRLVDDLGCIIAMLCVCSAMSRTLDKNYPSDQLYDYKGSFFEHFKDDLHRWGLLYRKPTLHTHSMGWERDYEMTEGLSQFIRAVKIIWGVDTKSRVMKEYSIDCFGADSVRYFGDLASKLVLDLDDILYPANASNGESEEVQRPGLTQQVHQPRRVSSHDTSGHHTRPHRLKNMNPEWAVVVTSAIFLILFIFLTWLRALREGHNAPAVLFQADLILTRAERESATFLDRIVCANQILKTLFERYGIVNPFDSVFPDHDQHGTVDTGGTVPFPSPVLYPTPTSRQSEAPDIIQKENQTPTSNGISTHGGNNKFACTEDGCKKAYSLQHNLNKHMRNVHEDKKTCENCNKRYTTDGFKRHNCTNKDEEPSGPRPKRRKISNAGLGM